jgi:hypothetical protein
MVGTALEWKIKTEGAIMSEILESAKDLVPTDNLYKFMALFGLVLSVTSLILMWSEFRHNSEAINQLNINTAQVEAAIQLRSKHITYLERTLNNFAPSSSQPITTMPATRNYTTVELMDMLAFKNAIIGPAIQEGDNITTQMAVLKANTDNIRYSISESDLIIVKYRHAVIFGIGLSIFGFMLWYYRLQRYQDMMLRAEAIKKLKK